ncbi:MAG: hypothetical protein M3530_09420 [Thermoproteota archaeon]|nr:hypothetical protein [Thermoproteota archaeon]
MLQTDNAKKEARVPVGSVVSLWRYPIKSIFGQEPEYIHIENACFYVHTGNAVLSLSTVQGAYWRGKLSSIDGFVIGTIGPYPSSEQSQMK